MKNLENLSKNVSDEINKSAIELQQIINDKLDHAITLERCKAFIINIAMVQSNVSVEDIINSSKGMFVDVKV